MKIAFIYGDAKNLSADLTEFWTGSRCYHVGFTDGIHFWDMNLIRRRRLWPVYPLEKKVILIECPVKVTIDYLEHQLDTSEVMYGWQDYLLFALRPIYHFFGKSTRNAGGEICSEMVANDLKACGWDWEFKEVPSPADLEKLLLFR
jgi:hypothetical protein